MSDIAIRSTTTSSRKGGTVLMRAMPLSASYKGSFSVGSLGVFVSNLSKVERQA